MRNRPIILLGLLFCLLAVSGVWASKKAKPGPGLDQRRRAWHALNRLTFGPRPGEVDRVLAMGVDKWIDFQLHPNQIDDSAVDARLAPLRTLTMDTRDIIVKFPPPQLIKAVASGRMRWPRDPAERAIYEAQIERFASRKEGKTQAARAANENSMRDRKAKRREAYQFAESAFDDLMAMPADQRMAAIFRMSPEKRNQLARGLRPQQRLKLADSFSPVQREQWMALRSPQRVPVTELQQSRILRAAYSERQLQEVMTDFWFNHFNVFIGKGPDRYWTTAYERDVIRPHAMGKFKDLLMATAKSPAMLWYLDNWDSVGPDSQFALDGPERLERFAKFARRRRSPITPAEINRIQQNMPKGLNENYARELMELQTLGVDGGYTQHDVTEVAKVFTGWTISQPGRGGVFTFDQRRHEPGPKFVLGQNIKQDGENEGIKVLQMLASSPSTARFISKKLAIRFVSDNPPQSLVDRMASTYLNRDGDITAVLSTMFHSPEFWAPEAYRAKVKTPLEFVVSAIRATGTNVTNALPLLQVLNRMGMAPYMQPTPNGYSMTANSWVNSAALIDRMNFALQLASGHLPGCTFDPQRIRNESFTSPEQEVSSFENALLDGDVSKQTHDTIVKQMSDSKLLRITMRQPGPSGQANVIAGLILGSPEFQRR